MTKKLLVFQLLLLVSVVFCEFSGKVPGVKRRVRPRVEYETHYANLKAQGGKLFTKGFLDDAPWEDYFIGTPPQYYILNVETGFNKLWLIDPSYSFADPDQQTYDPSESSTSVDKEDSLAGYTGRYELYGSKYADVIDNGVDAKWNQTFGTIEQLFSSETNISIPVDGILGLAYNPEENIKKLTEKSSPLLHLLESSERKILSVWQDRDTADFGTIYESFLGFGKIDYDLCEKDITYVKVQRDSSSDTLLSFTVDGFQIGDYKTTAGSLAKVDTGAAILYVPKRPYRAIYKQLDPEYDWTLNLFVTDCANRDVFPDWVFTIGGRDFVLSAKDYVMDIYLPDNKCVVTFESSAELSIDYIIGNPFLRRYCSIFDLETGQLGLTNAIHTGGSDSTTPRPPPVTNV